MIFCTICAANDLPKAANMAACLKRTQESPTIVLCLLEETSVIASEFQRFFSRIIAVTDLGLADLSLMMFRHNVYEACCALKPDVLRWALSEYASDDLFLYMDPDVASYGPFEEMERELTASAIVVTPHHTQDETALGPLCDNVLRSISTGLFNSGIIGIHRSKIATEFLEWWSGKTHMLCVCEVTAALYVDQRWLDLAICLFPLTVLKHEGYNVAHWNISKRVIKRDDTSKGYTVNGSPLRCFHFSLTSTSRDLYYFNKYCAPNDVAFDLRKGYVDEIARYNLNNISGVGWSYDRFQSGELIAPEVRELFRCGMPMCEWIDNPFGCSNSFLWTQAAHAARCSAS